MSYYSDFGTNLDDMHFNADVLTEDMFEEFQKDPRFQGFLYITNPIVHFTNTPEHGPHITMLEFSEEGGNVGGCYFEKYFEHAAEILNLYANAPLSGEVLRVGEDIGDFEKYTIHENGTVTNEKITSIA